MTRGELHAGDDDLRIAKGGAKRVDDKSTWTGLTLARVAWLRCYGSRAGPPPDLGQARDVVAMVKSTSFAPRVPPRELREHLPPARWEILHFAKTHRNVRQRCNLWIADFRKVFYEEELLHLKHTSRQSCSVHGAFKNKMWPFVAERVIPLKELRWSRTMLTSPRTVREISRSSVLAEQGRLTAFPILPLARSVERLHFAILSGLGRASAWPGVFFFVGLLTSQSGSLCPFGWLSHHPVRFAGVYLNPRFNAARSDVTGTRRLQICLVHIAGDNRIFRSIYGSDARPDRLDRTSPLIGFLV